MVILPSSQVVPHIVDFLIGENIVPQPVMEVYVTKTKLDEPSSSRRSGGE